MTSRIYTDEERAHALDLYREHGPAEASRLTGVPKRTISRWALRAGVSTEAATKRAAAVAVASVASEERKQRLAGRLIEEAFGFLEQLHKPSIERKVVTAAGAEGGWTVAEVRRDRPTYAEQQRIMTSVGIAVDKIQVLTGGATQRIDVTGRDVDREVEQVAADIVSLAARREQRAQVR